MKLKTVKITELKPHEKNPRQHPDSAIAKLTRSIQEFGWTNPVLVSKDGVILTGHARLKAAENCWDTSGRQPGTIPLPKRRRIAFASYLLTEDHIVVRLMRGKSPQL